MGNENNYPLLPMTEQGWIQQYEQWGELKKIIPALDWITCNGGRCCRLYIDPGQMKYCFHITVTIDEKGSAALEVAPIFANAVPIEGMTSYYGERKLWRRTAEKFFRRLERCGAWELGNAHTNSRDGVAYFHVFAARDIGNAKGHSFYMHNPQWHKDPVYNKIVCLYSDQFLGKEYSMKHEGELMR